MTGSNSDSDVMVPRNRRRRDLNVRADFSDNPSPVVARSNSDSDVVIPINGKRKNNRGKASIQTMMSQGDGMRNEEEEQGGCQWHRDDCQDPRHASEDRHMGQSPRRLHGTCVKEIVSY